MTEQGERKREKSEIKQGGNEKEKENVRTVDTLYFRDTRFFFVYSLNF